MLYKLGLVISVWFHYFHFQFGSVFPQKTKDSLSSYLFDENLFLFITHLFEEIS